MRKLLYLASFTAQSGENKFEEKRLILIEEREGDDHVSITQRAYHDIFQPWFKKNYPESKLESFMAHETLSAVSDKADSKIYQIKWREPIQEGAPFYFWIGADPLGHHEPLTTDASLSSIYGEGGTKAEAALALVERLMCRNDIMVIQYFDVDM